MKRQYCSGSVLGLGLFNVFVMAWRVGLSEPSERLVTPRAVQWTVWRKGMPSRANCTGLSTGPTKTSQSQGHRQGPAHGMGQSQEEIQAVQRTESSPEENVLEVLVAEKHNVSRWCAFAAQKAKCFLDCFERSGTNKLREVILPLHSCEISPGELHSVLGPSIRRMLTRWKSPGEGHKKHLSTGAPLLWRHVERVAVVEHGEEKAPGRAAFQYLKGASRKIKRGFYRGM